MPRRARWIDISIVIGVPLLLVGLLVWAIWAALNAFSENRFQVMPAAFADRPNQVGTYVLVCLAIGFLTMALIQVGRTLLPLRGYFQRFAFTGFLDAGVHSFPGDGCLPKDLVEKLPRVLPEKASARLALREFQLLADRGGKGRWWHGGALAHVFDLPIEQLCGQLHIAFEAALETPARFPNLLLCIVREDGLKELLLAMPSESAEMKSPTEPAKMSAESQEDRDLRLMRQSEARSSISRLGQQRIDFFQINTGGEWRTLLRLAVLGISLLLSWQLSSYAPTGQDKSSFWPHFLQAAFMALIATYASMFFRDLTAILELKRNRS